MPIGIRPFHPGERRTVSVLRGTGAFRLIVVVLFFPATSGAVDDHVGRTDAEGQFSLALRYRYERVEDDAFAPRGVASTLRTRLSWESTGYRGLSALIEVDDITPLGPDRFDSTANGRSGLPVVADPEGTEVNQAVLRYRGIKNSEIAAGRVRINLANERFVGGVGWRQNEQTFDGFSLANRSFADVELFYAWIGNVNRVFGPDGGTQLSDWDSDSHLMHVTWKVAAGHELSAYSYLLDLEQVESLSNRTAGLRLTGARAAGGALQFAYTIEHARQSDYGRNPSNYVAGYSLLEFSAGTPLIRAMAGLEILDGDATAPAARFVTPLATLHPFQGWADKFSVTPSTGIEDLYTGVSSSYLGTHLAIVYHRFKAQASGSRYGDEWDFSLSRKLAGRYDAQLKFAHYDADDFSSDTRKLWLMISAAF